MKTGLCQYYFFPPCLLCTSLQQTLGKQVDATFAEYSKTEAGVSPSVQGSANCKLLHGMLCSSFHRWTMSLLIFLVGPMGYFLSPRIGLLLVVALPEVSVPILLSSSSRSQYTTSAKYFRDLPKLTCQFSCCKSEDEEVFPFTSACCYVPTNSGPPFAHGIPEGNPITSALQLPHFPKFQLLQFGVCGEP